MNDKPSNANSWADLWVNAQRQYWNTWLDAAQKMQGTQDKKPDQPLLNPWAQTLAFWANFATPEAMPKPPDTGREGAPDISGPRDWAELWMKTQRQYWETWFDLSRSMAGASSEPGGSAESPAGPWLRLLELWSSFLMPLMPTQSHEWASRLIEINKAYFQMGEGVWKILSSSYAAAQGTDNPWDSFSRGLRQMQDDFAESLGKDPWSGFATFWGMPLDNWRRVCSAVSILPGDMEKAVRGLGSPYGPETLHRTMVGMLSMPTIGYTREWQEELQRWGVLWLEHHQALQEYGSVLARINFKAMELFGERLQAQYTQHKPVESLRAFYNLWIDCAEDAYAEISNAPDFVKAQSHLTNSLFAIKRQEQKMVDELLTAFNMPTRRELDTSHRRVHQLQRRVWQVEQLVKEAGIGELREEIAALQREVEALQAGSGAAKTEKPEKAASRRGGPKSPVQSGEEI
jgi:class III poly(R)-hydroxyalkanoic acid synthase PhaE subunit